MRYEICMRKTNKDGERPIIINLDWAETFPEAKQKALAATTAFCQKIRIARNNIVVAQTIPTGEGKAVITSVAMPNHWILD